MPYFPGVKGFGHGRLGRLPDDPYRQWKYTKKSGLTVAQDNYQAYIEAFLLSVKATACYLKGEKFDGKVDESVIDNNKLNVVKEILALRSTEGNRSRLWQNKMPELFAISDTEERELEFNKNWIVDDVNQKVEQKSDREIKKPDQFYNTDYYKFVKASEHHTQFIDAGLQKLANNSVKLQVAAKQSVGDPILWPVPGKKPAETDPKGTPLKLGREFYLSIGSGLYAAHAALEFFASQGAKEYFPIADLKKMRVPLTFLLPDNEKDARQLQDGDVVLLKTLEVFDEPEYCYLGFWSKTWYPYYYKQYNKFETQKWIVKKIGGDKTKGIAFGDKITLVNKYYSDYYLGLTAEKDDQRNSFYALKEYNPQTCDLTIE